MIRLLGNWFLLVLPVFLIGCAVGNQYRYQTENIGLPLESREDSLEIGVGVKDARSYILSGKKPATFVGLQRGGFGNPFSVTTASNLPFAMDVSEILVHMLRRYGYETTMSSSSKDVNAFTQDYKARNLSRAVFLNISEWKTDIYSSVTLHFGLELLILDGDGTVLARSEQNGVEVIGGYTLSGNDEKASKALATKLSYLFVDPKIQSALK